ncbi:hypothetical protein NDN08_002707 [Rhodosorus marinus]|uniref:Uncharacterized protein n=1 Tax=Rhodosorus marinus TaxID=101924 RepID=A0AAV8UUJ1_9RHOD|nr:hypothetical protein NDN08_002707 [Rhodosorus marinus]
MIANKQMSVELNRLHSEYASMKRQIQALAAENQLLKKEIHGNPSRSNSQASQLAGYRETSGHAPGPSNAKPHNQAGKAGSQKMRLSLQSRITSSRGQAIRSTHDPIPFRTHSSQSIALAHGRHQLGRSVQQEGHSQTGPRILTGFLREHQYEVDELKSDRCRANGTLLRSHELAGARAMGKIKKFVRIKRSVRPTHCLSRMIFPDGSSIQTQLPWHLNTITAEDSPLGRGLKQVVVKADVTNLNLWKGVKKGEAVETSAVTKFEKQYGKVDHK